VLVISRLAGCMQPPLDAEVEKALARTPAEELLALPYLAWEAEPKSGAAYAVQARESSARGGPLLGRAPGGWRSDQASPSNDRACEGLTTRS